MTTRNLQFAICNPQSAICNLQSATTNDRHHEGLSLIL